MEKHKPVVRGLERHPGSFGRVGSIGQDVGGRGSSLASLVVRYGRAWLMLVMPIIIWLAVLYARISDQSLLVLLCSTGVTLIC